MTRHPQAQGAGSAIPATRTPQATSSARLDMFVALKLTRGDGKRLPHIAGGGDDH